MRISTPQFFQNSTNSILDRQAALVETQLQIATGRRVLTPSDDPVASTLILDLREQISQTEQFNENIVVARRDNELEDTVLSGVTDALFEVQEQFIAAGNGTNTTEQFQAIAATLEARLDELVGLANTRNATGEYIFSGFQTDTQPYVTNGNGEYTYQGDQGQRQIRVSSNVQIAANDTGFEIFEKVLTGNGTYGAAAGSANAGSGVITTSDSVAGFVSDDYTIEFVTNSSGELAYNVIGANSGQVVPALPADPVNDAPAYSEGAQISFNGASVTISGTPAVGDTFTVEPAQSQNIFETIHNVIDSLKNFTDTDAGRAELRNTLNQAIPSLENGFDNVQRVRATVGARLNAAEAEENTNLSLLTNDQTALSSLEEVDLVEAITRFQQQTTALQAAQQTFARISNLSLFNFLN